MPLNPSPQRQSIVTFPTPNVNDILFFESVDAERVGTDIPAYGTKHPDYKKWPNHRLVHVESSDDKIQGRYYRYYYAADQLNQDEDNWSFSKADIGGTKFDAVTRDYVVRRSEFTPDTPAMGDAMDNVPVGKFSVTHVLAERKQVPLNDKVLNGLYVVEQRVYVKKVPLTRLDFDDYFQTTNKTEQTLYYRTETPDGVASSTDIESLAVATEHAYWGMTAGTVRTVQQLSANWYAVTEQQVVKCTAAGCAGLSYETVVNYAFPPILQNVAFDVWNLRSGGARTYPRVLYTKGAYRGPCKAQVDISWSVAQPTGLAASEKPEPKAFALQTPLFSLSIPPTLHAAMNFAVSVGTEDETWEPTNGNFPMDATNVTEWLSHIISSEVKPFRGGWILETVTVYPPS
jgi:hypothetical protein